MPEFVEMYNRARKWLLYLMSIFVLGWGFTSYHAIFLGLIVGTAFSFGNLAMLFRKMKMFDKSITNGKKFRSAGSPSRMAMAAIAVIFAIKWPHYFDAISVVMGLMTSYIVIMIDYLFRSFYVHKTK
jgi:ATP synthase protein I